MVVAETSDFLPNLTHAFTALDASTSISTADFTSACAKVMPIFDHLSTVFVIAKHEFSHKRDTVEQVAGTHPTLSAIVEAGKQDGSITKKNSPARNLHRLSGTLSFISAIFQNLAAGQTLRDAVSEAYDRTLGLLHTWVVRAGIKTGMVALPSRETFLASIGETEASAQEHAKGFCSAAGELVGHIEELYKGVEMPRSDFTVKSLWS